MAEALLNNDSFLNSKTASTGHRKNVGWWRFFLLRPGGDERRMRGGNYFARSEVSSMITSSSINKRDEKGLFLGDILLAPSGVTRRGGALASCLEIELFKYKSTRRKFYDSLAFCTSARLSFKAVIALSMSPRLSSITLTPICPKRMYFVATSL